MQREGNGSTAHGDTAAWLIDYLLSLNIDYQWLLLAGTSLLAARGALGLPAARMGFFHKLNVQSHEFSCFGTD